MVDMILIAGIFMLSSCNTEKKNFINENVNFAEQQTKNLLISTGAPTGTNIPRTIDSKEDLTTTNIYNWTSGFFPGTLWYLYELTDDTYWKTEAEKWTAPLKTLKTYKKDHDIGFMMYCSYGNANRLIPTLEYKDILVESAKCLATRFDEKTSAIKSWNYRKAWNGRDEWHYPVIIDNMMNLELLFYASKATGDKRYYNIAVKHAETTLRNHFREDYSTYHVVNYDPETGKVLYKGTCQGFSDNSTWSRGQAWAIYGFTMTYRETKDKRFLRAATKAADFFIKHLNENNLIPAWDFNVAQPGYSAEGNSYAVKFQKTLKDASAGAVVCSALFELGQYSPKKGYTQMAVKMLKELASGKYRAKLGCNGDFLLKHSVGSIPHKTEIDVPLVYADYYFLEALIRYRNLKSNL